MRHDIYLGRDSGRSLAAVAAFLLLAGCSGASVVPAVGTPSLPGAQLVATHEFAIPDAGPPPCKGQKNTKKYASAGPQQFNSKGGSVCVPAFGGWGGGLQFPSVNPSQTVSLTSSTTEYQPSLFPPAGSQKAIFYIQFTFSGFPQFGANLPAGTGIVSAKVQPKKPYTAQLWENIGGGLWSDLSSCYSIAKAVKLGGGIPSVGGVFKNQFFREPGGVIEIFSGKSSSTQC